MAKRTPVGIAACNDQLYAICDDGTLWQWDSLGNDWEKKFMAIPGTAVGEEKRKKK